MSSESAEGYTVLRLGCGLTKPDGHFGVDKNPRSSADLNIDLDVVPWPLPDDHFEEVHCGAIIEHLHNFYQVFEEIHRVCKNRAKVHVFVPHYTDTAAFTDPTHVKFFNTYSFDVLTRHTAWSYYTNARFNTLACRVSFLKLWKLAGAECIINQTFKHHFLRSVRKFWENYLCFIIRAKAMEITLEVVK